MVNTNTVTPDMVFPKGAAKRCAGFPTLTGWGYPAKGVTEVTLVKPKG
jgi:hypothetical protein